MLLVLPAENLGSANDSALFTLGNCGGGAAIVAGLPVAHLDKNQRLLPSAACWSVYQYQVNFSELAAVVPLHQAQAMHAQEIQRQLFPKLSALPGSLCHVVSRLLAGWTLQAVLVYLA